ncbi:hypothetical protein J6590_052564 [Homalodisca vitripennis]|nr:hypothetical protein J6590_052564 [Homalodisca vitripennis]
MSVYIHSEFLLNKSFLYSVDQGVYSGQAESRASIVRGDSNPHLGNPPSSSTTVFTSFPRDLALFHSDPRFAAAEPLSLIALTHL